MRFLDSSLTPTWLNSQEEWSETFADLRPISLSTSANNILPSLISSHQTVFVKGRSIIENVLLAQEIIRDVNKRNKHHNIVVKSDMTKAYDSVSWIYLTKVTRQFGFSEIIIDMMWRLVSHNWLTVSHVVSLNPRGEWNKETPYHPLYLSLQQRF